MKKKIAHLRQNELEPENSLRRIPYIYMEIRLEHILIMTQ